MAEDTTQDQAPTRFPETEEYRAVVRMIKEIMAEIGVAQPEVALAAPHESIKPAEQRREIEVKVSVKDAAPLLAFLAAEGTYEAEHHQRDEYFTSPDRDFLAVKPVKEWLRLRDEDGKSSVNYKYWQYNADGKSNHCDEFEVALPAAAPMKAGLEARNFRPVVVVDKKRKTWRYEDYQIAVDTVEGLGDFIEVEYKGKDKEADPAQVTAQMLEFLKRVGCKEIERNYTGYPYLSLFPEANRG